MFRLIARVGGENEVVEWIALAVPVIKNRIVAPNPNAQSNALSLFVCLSFLSLLTSSHPLSSSLFFPLLLSSPPLLTSCTIIVMAVVVVVAGAEGQEEVKVVLLDLLSKIVIASKVRFHFFCNVISFARS